MTYEHSSTLRSFACQVRFDIGTIILKYLLYFFFIGHVAVSMNCIPSSRWQFRIVSERRIRIPWRPIIGQDRFSIIIRYFYSFLNEYIIYIIIYYYYYERWWRWWSFGVSDQRVCVHLRGSCRCDLAACSCSLSGVASSSSNEEKEK